MFDIFIGKCSSFARNFQTHSTIRVTELAKTSITSERRFNQIFLHAWELAYPNDKKTVNQNWLDALDWEGIAYWFMDDGTNARGKAAPHGSLKFCTHGFSETEVNLLATWMTTRGISCTVTHLRVKQPSGKLKHYYVLRVKQGSRDALIKRIRPFIIPSMRYKIKVLPLTRMQQCVWCGQNYEASVRLIHARNRPRCSDVKCAKLAGKFSDMKSRNQLARFTSHPLFLSARKSYGTALPIERELTTHTAY